MYLYEHEGCRLQMGGTDQWGNITTGTELIRRKLGGEALLDLPVDYERPTEQVRQD